MRLTTESYPFGQTGPFGLRREQMSGGEFTPGRERKYVHNAGWYNGRGEFIGWGDLTDHEIERIAAEIEDGETFIVVNEPSWRDTPGNKYLSPGMDYLRRHAEFIITRCTVQKGPFEN